MAETHDKPKCPECGSRWMMTVQMGLRGNIDSDKWICGHIQSPDGSINLPGEMCRQLAAAKAANAEALK